MHPEISAVPEHRTTAAPGGKTAVVCCLDRAVCQWEQRTRRELAWVDPGRFRVRVPGRVRDLHEYVVGAVVCSPCASAGRVIRSSKLTAAMTSSAASTCRVAMAVWVFTFRSFLFGLALQRAGSRPDADATRRPRFAASPYDRSLCDSTAQSYS